MDVELHMNARKALQIHIEVELEKYQGRISLSSADCSMAAGRPRGDGDLLGMSTDRRSLSMFY